MAGLSAPDDAAVWKIDNERSLVATVDFFTPIVDDPYDYGSIAAANSLSDIYAMGGTPFLALNIAAMPPQIPFEIITEIFRGGAEKTKEAGVVIAGGHTIQDKEPKYGMVVLGFVPNDRILTKGGMKPGDSLFLSKPIGSGIISSAIKAEKIKDGEYQEMIRWMKVLNKDASFLAVQHSASAVTDITGFSLLGHAWEMASASGVGICFNYNQIPLYDFVDRFAKEWCFPGGSFDNEEFYAPHLSFDSHISQNEQFTLFDPQTSGGLLFSIPESNVQQCELDAIEKGIPLWKIGEVTDSGKIEVVK